MAPNRLIPALLMSFFAACAIAPPIQEMSDARQAVSAAREAGAATYAEEQYLAAEGLLNEATQQLDSGAYLEARDLALRAKDAAQSARDTAIAAGKPGEGR